MDQYCISTDPLNGIMSVDNIEVELDTRRNLRKRKIDSIYNSEYEDDINANDLPQSALKYLTINIDVRSLNHHLKYLIKHSIF